MKHFKYGRGNEVKKVRYVKWSSRGEVEVVVGDEYRVLPDVDDFVAEVYRPNPTAPATFSWTIDRLQCEFHMHHVVRLGFEEHDATASGVVILSMTREILLGMK